MAEYTYTVVGSTGVTNVYKAEYYVEDFIPEHVIFNGKTTIVYWKDGSKTVVKCSEDEQFVPEMGVAQAIARKVFNGNRSKFLRVVDDAYVQPEPKKKVEKKSNTLNYSSGSGPDNGQA